MKSCAILLEIDAEEDLISYSTSKISVNLIINRLLIECLTNTPGTLSVKNQIGEIFHEKFRLRY